MTIPEPFYEPNTPLLKTPYSDWQTSFLANFKRLYDAFDNNHVALDAASNTGNHTYVQLFQQETTPQTGVSEFSVYTRNFNSLHDVENNTDQLYMSYPGNSEFQFSTFQIYPIISNQFQTAYFTWLPGGIIVYFGTFVAVSTSSINLDPQVCKEIFSVNYTTIGTTGITQQVSFSPVYSQDKDIVTALNIGSASNKSIFYLIMGNTV